MGNSNGKDYSMLTGALIGAGVGLAVAIAKVVANKRSDNKDR